VPDLTTSTVPISDRAPLSGTERVSAAALLGATILALADLLSGDHAIALFALALILVHVGCRWPHIRVNARLMLIAASTTSVVFILTGGDPNALSLVASRALYLPALIAVMAILRVAAQQARLVSVAARFVVDQPPSRRFLLLASAAHIFGILLSIGGFQLLLAIALAERDRTAPSPEAAEIQGRRITNAVMRGFGSTLMWSPVGLAINLLMPIMPSLVWADYAPIGLSMVAGFLLLGWLFDRMEPHPKREFRPQSRAGAASALFALFALLIAITGSAWLVESAFDLPLRAAILIVIPIMAVAWVLVTEPGPAATSVVSLGMNGFRMLTRSASEICLLAATGFLGLIIADMIPPATVRAVVETLALGPGLLGCLVLLTITLTGLVGVSPMISGTICAGAVLSSGVAIPEAMLMMACLSGWVGSAMLSSATATVAIAGTLTGKSSTEIGLRWNGLFTLTYLGLIMVVQLVWAAAL
jgi:hypothetical protein